MSGITKACEMESTVHVCHTVFVSVTLCVGWVRDPEKEGYSGSPQCLFGGYSVGYGPAPTYSDPCVRAG